MNVKRARYKDLEKFPVFKVKKSFKEDFFGSSPAPFVGRFGYPQVNIGVLSPQFSKNTEIYDQPKEWSIKKFPIQKIASLRYELVNYRQKAGVLDCWKGKNKLLEICQEVGMASKPVELEVNLEKKPQLRLEKDSQIIPFGPTGEVKASRITENSKIDSKVDKVVADIDLKAIKGVWNLYKNGFDETFLTKLISVGNLGMKKNRKLVPTRWSITSVDSIIGNNLLKEVKDYSVGDYSVYFGGEWGNYYLILLFPEVWSYELFETYLNYQINAWSKKGLFYSTDYEPYLGRKNYAEETAGGFYAARLSLLEKLKEVKKQHSCLVLRFITPDYDIPLGVFVCREATRSSLKEKPLVFASRELMLKYAIQLIKRKFNFDLESLFKESKLLKNIKTQKKLSEF